MNTCPLFEKCGGCKFDFAANDYREKKLALLKNAPLIIDEQVWIAPGGRRRADFSFTNGKFGFFANHSKDIIQTTNCPALSPALNEILPAVAALPWTGAGGALLTECANGIDVAITTAVPYFSPGFGAAAAKIGAIRISWNNRIVFQSAQPIIKFGDAAVDYPVGGAFLQPSVISESVLRDLVVGGASFLERCRGRLGNDTPPAKTADLFCGLGSFTFALNADGFDIQTQLKQRDLFKKPLTARELGKYDCVVLDPPRAGCDAQCREIVKSTNKEQRPTNNLKTIVYVSCNPDTFLRDAAILTRGGWELNKLTIIDQFPGTAHWELVGIFNK